MKAVALSLLIGAAMLQTGFPRDCNDELRTAFRADVIGPEMWTFAGRSKGLRTGRGDAYLDAQLPSRMHVPLQPGLSGELYVVHGTELRDVLGVEFDCDGRPLVLTAVGNVWTPAFCRTRYRSDACECDGEPVELGDTVYVECKCITTNNVFVAEGVLRNAGARRHTYRIGFRTHPTLPVAPGVFRFGTVAMCKKVSRRIFVAPVTPRRELELAPNTEVRFRYALALSPESAESAQSLVDMTLAAVDPFADNAAAFNAWMDRNVPRLDIDDASLRKLYDYRWFVVWRSLHDARRLLPDHPYPRTAAYESPNGDWFACVIGLPVPMQVQEMAWMRDPSAGRAHLLNWCEGVLGYRRYIQYTGMAAWRFLQNHPDIELARQIAMSAGQAAEARAGKDDSLPVQVGSWETGAEYQPNFYQFTEPKWDFRHDTEFMDKTGLPRTKLVRLDTTVYVAASLLGASHLAWMAGDEPIAAKYRDRAERMLALVRRKHWDERLGLFLAADPESGRLADEAACYDSFVPYMFGLIDETKYFRAFDKFCSPAWFWDEFAVTTVAKTCPMYCGGNFLRGPLGNVASDVQPHRYGCCWNGPVWHYADSLMAEAFGSVARKDASRRSSWRKFFRNWTESHFPYGDRSTPRAAEHFRPEDGARLGAAFDYFHSSWIDPFIRYWCGVSVVDDLKRLVFEPFSDVDFKLRYVPVAGWEFDFEKCGERLTVRLSDGRILVEGRRSVAVDLQRMQK